MTRVGYSGSGTGAGAAAVAPGAAAPTGATGWARSSLGGSLSSSDLLSMEALGLREGAVGNALASVDHPQVRPVRWPRQGATGGIWREGCFVKELRSCMKRDWVP